ncbi:hypothetical protein Tco_0785571 [Tanacetum coccineum]
MHWMLERLIFKDLVNEVVLGEASHGVLLWKGELLFVGRNSLLATVLFYRVWLSVQIAGDISGSTDIVKNQETVMAIGNDQLIECIALDLRGQFT